MVESKFQRIEKNFDRLKYGESFAVVANCKRVYEKNALKTIQEIIQSLVRVGARSAEIDFEQGGAPVGIIFKMTAEGYCVRFKIICNYRPILKRLRTYKDTAIRMAWSQHKEWVDSQLNAVEAGIMTVEEAFMMYALKDGKTFFEKVKENIKEYKV